MKVSQCEPKSTEENADKHNESWWLVVKCGLSNREIGHEQHVSIADPLSSKGNIWLSSALDQFSYERQTERKREKWGEGREISTYHTLFTLRKHLHTRTHHGGRNDFPKHLDLYAMRSN